LQVVILKTQTESLLELQAETSKWLEAHPAPPSPLSLANRNARLEELQTGVRVVAEETLFKKKKKPSRYFFGSFPAPLRLLKIHLYSLVRLRRLLAFPISPRSFSAGSLRGPRLRRYLAIVASWRHYAPEIQAAMDDAERFHNPLDSDTSRDPEWWFSARCVDEIWDSIALDIPFLNRRCKRVYRSLRSASIPFLVKRRQLRLTSGRMRSALASLLGTQRLSFLYDTLLCDDGSSNEDPVVIHRSIQRHYMRHFAVDQDSLLQLFQLDLPDLGSATTWDVFLLDPDAMVQAFFHPANGDAPTAVPREFVEAIARAFQQSPAARALEADLSASLETPFLFEEFLYALSCGRSAALGESGVSYRLLQVTTLSVQEEIFIHLQEFWTASSTPDQWQRVLLILIRTKMVPVASFLFLSLTRFSSRTSLRSSRAGVPPENSFSSSTC
jgi:hypothetical protein